MATDILPGITSNNFTMDFGNESFQTQVSNVISADLMDAQWSPYNASPMSFYPSASSEFGLQSRSPLQNGANSTICQQNEQDENICSIAQQNGFRQQNGNYCDITQQNQETAGSESELFVRGFGANSNPNIVGDLQLPGNFISLDRCSRTIHSSNGLNCNSPNCANSFDSNILMNKGFAPYSSFSSQSERFIPLATSRTISDSSPCPAGPVFEVNVSKVLSINSQSTSITFANPTSGTSEKTTPSSSATRKESRPAFKSRPETRNTAKRFDESQYGKMSYAELITLAIENSPDGRLTLSKIYEWMMDNVPYFKERSDNVSSSGWKNSIRHNLSLHTRFRRVTNETAGKSSWWMIDYTVPAPSTAPITSASQSPSSTGRIRSNTIDPKMFSNDRKQIRLKKKTEENTTSTSTTTPSVNTKTSSPKTAQQFPDECSPVNELDIEPQRRISAYQLPGNLNGSPVQFPERFHSTNGLKYSSGGVCEMKQISTKDETKNGTVPAKKDFTIDKNYFKASCLGSDSNPNQSFQNYDRNNNNNGCFENALNANSDLASNGNFGVKRISVTNENGLELDPQNEVDSLVDSIIATSKVGFQQSIAQCPTPECNQNDDMVNVVEGWFGGNIVENFQSSNLSNGNLIGKPNSENIRSDFMSENPGNMLQEFASGNNMSSRSMCLEKLESLKDDSEKEAFATLLVDTMTAEGTLEQISDLHLIDWDDPDLAKNYDTNMATADCINDKNASNFFMLQNLCDSNYARINSDPNGLSTVPLGNRDSSANDYNMAIDQNFVFDTLRSEKSEMSSFQSDSTSPNNIINQNDAQEMKIASGSNCSSSSMSPYQSSSSNSPNMDSNINSLSTASISNYSPVPYRKSSDSEAQNSAYTRDRYVKSRPNRSSGGTCVVVNSDTMMHSSPQASPQSNPDPQSNWNIESNLKRRSNSSNIGLSRSGSVPNSILVANARSSDSLCNTRLKSSSILERILGIDDNFQTTNETLNMDASNTLTANSEQIYGNLDEEEKFRKISLPNYGSQPFSLPYPDASLSQRNLPPYSNSVASRSRKRSHAGLLENEEERFRRVSLPVFGNNPPPSYQDSIIVERSHKIGSTSGYVPSTATSLRNQRRFIKESEQEKYRRISLPNFGSHPFFGPVTSGQNLSSFSHLEKMCRNSPFQSILEDLNIEGEGFPAAWKDGTKGSEASIPVCVDMINSEMEDIGDTASNYIETGCGDVGTQQNTVVRLSSDGH